MKIKNILLLEPVNTPIEILTKQLNNLKENKKQALLVYAAGLVYRKAKIKLTSLHSIPLGLAQLSSIVKEEGINTYHIPFILDSSKRYISNEEIENKIKSFDYDTVWMTVGSPEAAYETIRYAKITKKINNKTPIMIGGIFPSMFPNFFLENREIDYLIRGPAEIAVKQYVKNPEIEKAKKIQGFCYRKNGDLKLSSKYAIEPDLSKIPPYDFEGLCIAEYMKDNHYCNIQVSRGCPYNCPFCTHTKYWGLKVNYRPIENLRKELRILENYGCELGYMVDSTFTLNMNYMRKFTEIYKEEGINIKLWYETRADLFNEEAAKLSNQIRTPLVWFGAESGATEVLRRLRGKSHGNGKLHVKNLKKAVILAKKYDLLCGSSWVLGLPGETKNTIEETRKVIFYLSDLGMDICDVRILQIFPSTPYWEEPEKWGLELIEKDYSKNSPWDKYAGHNTEGMTSNEIVKSANSLKEDLYQYYITKTRNMSKRKKNLKPIQV
jgi:radical SAM superfamily enzyme YgiQ (UPF0313 family)